MPVRPILYTVSPLAIAARLLIVCTAATSLSAVAQTTTPQIAYAAQALDEISVTATRSETHISHTPSSISVINAETIAQQQAKDIKDLLRYEAGVTVRRAPYRPASAATAGGRGGNEGINIRGLEGNRILLMEDGIRLPSTFSFGPLESGRGDYGEMDLYKRVEILRGPASAMYGSDGLTGAVNFITKDPADFLSVFNKPTYFSIKPSYDSADGSTSTTAVAAFGGEQFQAMLIANKRKGHEVKSQGKNSGVGPNRDAANPQDADATSLLGKVVFNANPRNKLTFTIEHHEKQTTTNVLSAITPTTLGLNADDKLERNRYSLDYDYKDDDNTLFQKAHAQVYYQDASNRQFSYEPRTPAANRSRDNRYDESIVGASVQAESAFNNTSLQHKLVYGFDASTARITGLRNGTVSGFGEAPFPNKAFPDTDYSLFGVFLQDEIRLSANSAFSLIPGIRFDAYRLSPQMNDAAYGGTPTKSSGNAVSPRLAIMYEINPALIPYAQYARGFRTPTPDQVNNSFGNPTQGYVTIGNPDLKPETSDTFELGLRGKISGLSNTDSTLRYSTAVFTGRYKNFISQQVISGSGRPYADPFIYQYINTGNARISGIEARLDWQLANGIGIKTGMAYTKGSTEQNGKSQPLDTINPFMAVLGLRYEPSEKWFTQADISYQAGKRKSDMANATAATNFAPSSSVSTDIRAGYNINKTATLYAGVSNLFDNKYWNWSDVRGLADSATVKDAYAAPGRSFNVGLKLQY